MVNGYDLHILHRLLALFFYLKFHQTCSLPQWHQVHMCILDGGRNQQLLKCVEPLQKIPPMFHQHLNEQATGPVSLKGPSGNKWQAALASESEVLCFEQGWKEFVTDHGNILSWKHFCNKRFPTFCCKIPISKFWIQTFCPNSFFTCYRYEEGTKKRRRWQHWPLQIESGKSVMVMCSCHLVIPEFHKFTLDNGTILWDSRNFRRFHIKGFNI